MHREVFSNGRPGHKWTCAGVTTEMFLVMAIRARMLKIVVEPVLWVFKNPTCVSGLQSSSLTPKKSKVSFTVECLFSPLLLNSTLKYAAKQKDTKSIKIFLRNKFRDWLLRIFIKNSMSIASNYAWNGCFLSSGIVDAGCSKYPGSS